MLVKKHYCDFCDELPVATTNPNKQYHDTEYGFTVLEDQVLFERLLLEINQAGLSWTTILNKREHFRVAYAQYDIHQVAHFTDADIERLMGDVGIIRNRLKIKAAIYNANAILNLCSTYGSFKNWLDTHKGKSLEEWIKLFKGQFKFVGKEIVNEFLTSTAYLEGAHKPECRVYKIIKTL